MRQVFLQSIITLFLLTLAFQSHSQVTITENNYPRLNSFVDTLYQSTESNPALPTEGPDQMWDYSDLMVAEIIEREYYDATSDPDFPDALNSRISDLSFQGLIIESEIVERIDADGWGDMGRYLFDVGYSITNISGGPLDSLLFPETVDIFDGRTDYLDFPVEYEKEWNQSRIENVPFNLSVAAFGLNKTPGTRQRTVTSNRKVVGYGSLILPGVDGMPTAPLEVLLIKSTLTETDSIFLGGAPAPPAIMAAFGLTQGVSFTSSGYIFYSPNFGSYVMSYTIGAPGAFYRPQAAKGLTSNKNVEIATSNAYPNPISAGQDLTISNEKINGKGSIHFTDLSGRQVHQAAFTSAFDNKIHVKIPASIQTGIYIYKIHDANDNQIGFGKLQID